MARSTIAFVFLALACGAQLAAAYPSLYAAEHGCTDHPDHAYEGHGSPKPDSTIKFSVLDKTGKAVTAACPGTTYSVQVSFPNPRFALVTVSAGKFAKSTKCPSRQIFDKTTVAAPATTQTAELTVPCTATGPMKMQVTSAAGSSKPFMTASATLAVNPACKASSC